jgi:hypothetical protein
MVNLRKKEITKKPTHQKWAEETGAWAEEVLPDNNESQKVGRGDRKMGRGSTTRQSKESESGPRKRGGPKKEGKRRLTRSKENHPNGS